MGVTVPETERHTVEESPTRRSVELFGGRGTYAKD